jgi:hypothetical protein
MRVTCPREPYPDSSSTRGNVRGQSQALPPFPIKSDPNSSIRRVDWLGLRLRQG